MSEKKNATHANAAEKKRRRLAIERLTTGVRAGVRGIITEPTLPTCGGCRATCGPSCGSGEPSGPK